MMAKKVTELHQQGAEWHNENFSSISFPLKPAHMENIRVLALKRVLPKTSCFK